MTALLVAIGLALAAAALSRIARIGLERDLLITSLRAIVQLTVVGLVVSALFEHIGLAALFVLVMLTYICLRFRRKNNPVPSKTAHNTRLEVIWTVVPILILVAIAIPSLRIHYFMEEHVEPELTLKVTGYQWYWHYDYPDQGGFGFDILRQGGALDVGLFDDRERCDHG